MLTLERREDEVISITHGGETLDVKVSLIRGNKVKLHLMAQKVLKSGVRKSMNPVQQYENAL